MGEYEGEYTQWPMPALSPDEQDEIERLESLLGASLIRCGPHDRYDDSKALGYLRTYAVQFFEAYMKIYSQYSDCQQHWSAASQHYSVVRVMSCVNKNYEARNNFFSTTRKILASTIKDHHERKELKKRIQPPDPRRAPAPPIELRHERSVPLKDPPLSQTFSPALTGKQISAYQLAGIDIASPAPLVVMLHNAAQANRTDVQTPQAGRINSPPPESIGAQIKAHILEARLRPEDIAEEIGIQPRNVYRHLSGQTVPTLSNIGKYETALSKHLKRAVKLPTPEKRQPVSNTSAKRQ